VKHRGHAQHVMRPTSIEAYMDIITNLGERQKTILRAIIELYEKGGTPTDREIAQHLRVSDPNFVRPRRFELMKLGVIVESEKRICLVSNKKALTWKPLSFGDDVLR